MQRVPLSALAVVGTAILALAPVAQAQGKAVELSAGVLGVANVSCSGCTSVLTITTGGTYVAAGFYVSPTVAIEPSLMVSYASGSGSSLTAYGIGVGVPFYFDHSWGRKGWFMTPRATWNSYSCSGCSSASQFGLGMAIGGKVPLNSDAALRLQASYDYGFESGTILSTSTIGGSIGLSVFLK